MYIIEESDEKELLKKLNIEYKVGKTSIKLINYNYNQKDYDYLKDNGYLLSYDKKGDFYFVVKDKKNEPEHTVTRKGTKVLKGQPKNK